MAGRSLLHVCIVDGKDLVSMDMNGKSDPYVIVQVGRDRQRTSVQYKTLNPHWNEEFVFEVDLSKEGVTLQLIVWDEDRMSKDDFMGLIEIPVATLQKDAPSEESIRLNSRPGKNDKVSGSLRVKLLLTDNPSQENLLNHVFGVPIEALVSTQTNTLPPVFELCVEHVEKYGYDEEGIFRLSGSQTKLQELQKKFDEGGAVDLEPFKSDPHVVAALIKLFLRKLPEPLLTYDKYEAFLQASDFRTINRLVDDLPPANQLVLRRLLQMLDKISANHKVNKMTASNLAIVFGPNLLGPKNPSLDALEDTPVINKVVTTIIERARELSQPGSADSASAAYGANTGVVIWDYTARTETELSLVSGAQVQVSETKDGWANVVAEGGLTGWFPLNYISLN